MLERFVHHSTSVLHTWTWLSFLLLFLCISLCDAQQAGLRNVTLVNTSPEITYTPFLCNSTSDDPSCNGAWRVSDVDGSTVVSTDGPATDGLGIIPQMFLRFRATNLTMTTSSSSNASMNITVSSGTTLLNAVANSSIGSFSIVNLQETQTTTLSITYIQSPIQSHLDIGTITIFVSSESASTSIFPTQTLPPSIALPSIVSTSTSNSTPSTTSTSDSNSAADYKKKLIANAVGLTIGLGLGLTAVTCAIYLLWRRHRRKKRELEASPELGTHGIRNMESLQPTIPVGARLSSYRFSRPSPTKDNMDTRWFNF